MHLARVRSNQNSGAHKKIPCELILLHQTACSCPFPESMEKTLSNAVIRFNSKCSHEIAVPHTCANCHQKVHRHQTMCRGYPSHSATKGRTTTLPNGSKCHYLHSETMETLSYRRFETEERNRSDHTSDLVQSLRLQKSISCHKSVDRRYPENHQSCDCPQEIHSSSQGSVDAAKLGAEKN